MRIVFAIITTWLTFALALSGWWLIFGLETLNLVSEANSGYELVKHQKMLFYEGSFLMFLLLVGGLALFYFSYSMYREKSAKDKFFATFTHDLKTALFRLQLQVENIGRKKSYNEEEISLVLASTRQLHLELENGLDSTLGGQRNLFFEKINIQEFISDMHAQWPELSIRLKGEATVYADRKALSSVFKNLLHNSFVHGAADEVALALEEASGEIIFSYSDNGKAFSGEIKSLGARPHGKSQGTGFGLFLAGYWMKKMKGHLIFSQDNKGRLQVEMALPKGDL